MSQPRTPRAKCPRPRLVLLAITAALLGVPAAPARGDDATVARAYRAADRAAAAVERQLLTAGAEFELTHRAGPLLGALARARGLIVRTRRALLVQRASTDTGTRARSGALRAMSLAERAVLALRAGVLASRRGDAVAGRRLIARGKSLAAGAERADLEARALFGQAGSPAP